MGPKQRWIRTKDKIELINYRYGRERDNERGNIVPETRLYFDTG